MKKSLHILADLYQCGGELKYFTNKSRARSKVLSMIRRAGFKIVASRFHKFSSIGNDFARLRPAKSLTMAGEGGITGVVIVSESHLAIHTWPEKKFVNLDVFFCNYTRDNTIKARAVFKEFKKIYGPKRVRIREVWRD